MRDIDIKTLRLLVAVCEHQNIKHAAEQEHIEPSAISKRIAQLEGSLGTALLVRTRRGVQPTPAGMALLEHARTILFTLDRMASDITAFSGGVRGHVRVVASTSAIAEMLLDDVAAFMRDEANRNVKVDIEEALSRDIVQAVLDERAAVGICWDQADFKDLTHLPYRADQLALAVHESHELAGRKRIAFADTLTYEHVGLHPNSAVYPMLQRAAAQAGGTIAYRVVVSNFDAALRVVAANLGVSIIPMQVGSSYASKVKLIPLSDAWAKRQFAVCFKSQEKLQPPALRLVEYLTSANKAT
ncbi:LysR family transcriptional regulator [Noviherbaspirillum galbum]|uniref:LysR family transcriptional regulator n=1 Tax=Noviherbaspirillum galbum TaxID=2709383 RepID=A0A6B3SZJ6_9BURK|nr:LysR family transcriptional regulator [Noviherbaspirillum galbum]NEX64782.1 LysR family transcriptional regulator [Noviherbaspirillum galbum]